MAGVAPEPPLLSVQGDVCIRDDNLVWTGAADGGQDQVAVDQVLFTLDLSASSRGQAGFIICCLREDIAQPTQPFQLLLLAADAVPHQLVRISQVPAHLRSGDGNEVDVVVSTKSGLGLSLTFWQAVLQPLWGLAERVFGASSRAANVVVTRDAQSVRHFARSLQLQQGGSGRARDEAACRSRTVVLLSGDGGVADLLNGHGAAPTAPLIALLPLGTGNALFHSLHRPVSSNPGPSPLVLGLRTLFLGTPAPLPVFRAVFSPGSRIVSYAPPSGQAGDAAQHRRDTAVTSLYGAVVASYGFHASVVYESDTPEHRVHGDRRFGIVARELLREAHPYRARLSVRRPASSNLEPEPRETHAYVLVAMVSNLERSFTISPASEPLDGKLRLVHFGPVGGERTMHVMGKAYDGGRHVGIRWDDGHEVMYDEVAEVRVEALDADARWRKFCIDGTSVEVPEGGTMSVARAPGELFRVLVDPRVQHRA